LSSGYSSERDLICKGDMIQFFDESFNNIVSWNWSFPGATPASSNSQDPEVNYYTQGTYDVTLEVTDQMGNSMSKTFEDYITVMNNYSSGFPYTESFEDISSIPNDEWSVINENGPGFEISNEASFSGSQSVKLDNSSGSTGDVDELISQAIDLSNMISATISFKYAFAKRYSANTDFLRVYASFNCGETWMLRKNISSSSLPTHPNTTSSYIPTDDSWKTVNIPGISSAYLVNNFRLKFEFNCGGGNDLFIDNININGVVSFGEDELKENISLFPNPTNSQVKISFNYEPSYNNISIDLFDESGRLLKRISKNEFKVGNKAIEFSVSELEKGLYIINVNGQNQKNYIKFIKN
tara:strand:- start:353 stop:1411 length:1059 start_codon:yes stop_codon:yes gene_type:complete